MNEKPPLNFFLFISFVILLTFFANIVDSQQPPQPQSPPPPSPPPPSPPPPSPPPPSPPPPSPPPPFSPPPLFPPPPPRRPPPPPPQLYSPKFPNELKNPRPPLNPHVTREKDHNSDLNAGQKIGLLFAGIVVILQIGVVGFLAFKRRQLLRTRD